MESDACLADEGYMQTVCHRHGDEIKLAEIRERRALRARFTVIEVADAFKWVRQHCPALELVYEHLSAKDRMLEVLRGVQEDKRRIEMEARRAALADALNAEFQRLLPDEKMQKKTIEVLRHVHWDLFHAVPRNQKLESSVAMAIYFLEIVRATGDAPQIPPDAVSFRAKLSG